MLGWIKHIGLSWKVQLAPAFLIVVLIGLGAYALQTLRSNQAAVDALVSGPVRQSELANDLTTTVWTAHAKLYRLAATAANEKDEKKVAAVAKEASAAAGKISDALKAVEGVKGGFSPETFDKLKAAVAGYLKQSKNAIEMADGDAGSALMFIKGAERNFAVIEKLTDDLITHSSESKDREIARAGIKLEQQQMTLMAALLAVALAGILVSFLIGRGISRPVVAMSTGDARTGGRQFRGPVARPRAPRRSRPDGPCDPGIQGAGHRQGRTGDCRSARKRPANWHPPAGPSCTIWPKASRSPSAISSKMSARHRPSWKIPQPS